ncbi:MAG: SHOCT domain-containing protein [Candidatus Eremiobacteraeota bacterium]|nr:SHOCT domain-containing protein [Candidatus Eremiobacteraeota bacterium]
MRYVTMPRWIYYMLIVMGIGFAAGAVPFWLFVPVSGHFVAVVWVAMGAGFVFFSVRALVSRREDEQIARTGAAANATVLDARMTGMFINNVPQWNLRLRIDGYGAPYETKVKLLTFNPPSNGDTLSVRIDPARKDHVVFGSDDAPAASPPAAASAAQSTGGAADTVKVLADLERLRESGALAQDEFDLMKRKVLGES